LDAAGRGAWQDWSYEVELVNNKTNATSTRRRDRGTSVAVSGLIPGHIYHVRVRASSGEGNGPWSQKFTAQTLVDGTQSFHCVDFRSFILC